MKLFVNKNSLFVLVVLVISAGLYVLPTGFEDRIQSDAYIARAKVLEVDNSTVRTNLIIKTGIQNLSVEIIGGPHKGLKGDAFNTLTGKMELDEVHIPGRDILLEYSLNADGQIAYAVARGKYRLGLTALLMAMFSLLLISVAGWTGFKAMLSFVFSALVIWKLMIPLYLKGYDPVLVGLALVLVMIGVITFLVAGLNRRGMVTFLGSMLGLVLTGILAHIFTRGFRLHGAVMPFAETLLYSGFFDVNLNRLFQASVVTGASGAVIDLAMDISASMDEIYKANPRISIADHLKAGMSVGRSVIGTMTTTLLFAYSGSYIAMLMLFMGRGVRPVDFVNMHFVSAEVLNVLVGSFGLVTVAPFTVLVGGFLLRSQPRTANQAN